MQMQKLITGLMAKVTPHDVDARHTDLDQLIDQLTRRQDELQRRLATETHSAKLRRLQIELEVTRLQHRKAVKLLDTVTMP